MTPAAVQGTYADLKLVRGRKVAVICVEIPIEQAQSFVAAFGMPNPAEETWVALARLKQGAQAETDTPRKRALTELPAAQQAALTCQREAFWRYLREMRHAICDGEEDAAAYVRKTCHVNTRADLTTNPEARERWNLILSGFQDWMGTAA